MNPLGSRSIIYVGNFYFPNVSVGGTRVLGVGKALREAGYRVIFGGMEHRGREEDRQTDGGYVYQGFSYLPEKDQGHGRLAQLKRGLLTHAAGATTMRRLHAMDLSTTQCIIAYHASAPLLMQLMTFCRKRGLALIADCTEWYDHLHVQGGRLGPIFWDSELRMRWLQHKIGRVIVISSFLERYYRDRGSAVVRIPPLVDIAHTDNEPADQVMRDDGVLRLVYAGTPGKKDLLTTAVRGLRELRAAGAPVELHLVGLSRPAVDACVGNYSPLLGELGEAVVYHGRVAHTVATALVAQADFSILVRPNERFAQAGFPTKLVESLALGVPVITNLTSDIGEYVRDCRESVVLEGCDPEAFVAGVLRVLALPRERLSAMKVYARQRAAECFDYRNFVAPLHDFVERAIEGAPGRRRG